MLIVRVRGSLCLCWPAGDIYPERTMSQWKMKENPGQQETPLPLKDCILDRMNNGLASLGIIVSTRRVKESLKSGYSHNPAYLLLSSL